MDVARPQLRDRLWQAAYRVAYVGLRVWWRLRPVAHHGALVAMHFDGRLLLIRNSYRQGWNLPGGGVESGETSLEAAMREIREELGLNVAIDGEPTIVSGAWEGRPDTVDIFDLALSAAPILKLDNREVSEARFVAPAELSTMILTGPTAAYAALRWPSPPGHEHPSP